DRGRFDDERVLVAVAGRTVLLHGIPYEETLVSIGRDDAAASLAREELAAIVLLGVPPSERGRADVGAVTAEARGDDAEMKILDRLELADADGAGIGRARGGGDDVAEGVDARGGDEA